MTDFFMIINSKQSLANQCEDISISSRQHSHLSAGNISDGWLWLAISSPGGRDALHWTEGGFVSVVAGVHVRQVFQQFLELLPIKYQHSERICPALLVCGPS